MSVIQWRARLSRWSQGRATVLLLGLAAVAPGFSQSLSNSDGAALFAEPFVVVRSLEQSVAGTTTRLGDIRTVYAGSWLVIESQATVANGSDPSSSDAPAPRTRRLVDLESERIIEIDLQRQTLWSLSFARHRDLVRRYEMADGLQMPRAAPANQDGADDARIAVNYRVNASSDRPAASPLVGSRLQQRASGLGQSRNRRVGVQATVSAGASDSALALVSGPSSGEPDDADVVGSADVEVTSLLSMSPRALAALESYEAALRADEASATSVATGLIAAARRETGGQLIVQATASVQDRFGQQLRMGMSVAEVRLLAEWPAALLQVPEGLTEVVAPLEAIVVRLEQEQRLDRRGGR